MRKKTNTTESPSGTMTVTKEELAGMIQQGVAAERQNTIFNKRIKPYFVVLWSSRLAWFVAGLLICAMIFPFAEGGTPVNRWFRINPIARRMPDSPQAIAADAPNSTESDQRKRQTMVTAFRSVAEQIKEKTITAREYAFSALTTETANVLSVPAWKKTMDRIEVLLRSESGLDSFADKLNEISNNMEQ
jgi:hypothetical protein